MPDEMIYFELHPDVDRYKWITPTETPDRIRVTKLGLEQAERPWAPLRVSEIEEDERDKKLPYADFAVFTGRALLCLSMHAMECLRPLLHGGEILETTGAGHRYVLWHCLDVRDALIPQKSNFRPVNGRTLKLRSRLLSGDAFVLSELSTSFIVSDSFRRRVEEHDLTGFVFRPVDLE